MSSLLQEEFGCHDRYQPAIERGVVPCTHPPHPDRSQSQTPILDDCPFWNPYRQIECCIGIHHSLDFDELLNCIDKQSMLLVTTLEQLTNCFGFTAELLQFVNMMLNRLHSCSMFFRVHSGFKQVGISTDHAGGVSHVMP